MLVMQWETVLSLLDTRIAIIMYCLYSDDAAAELA